MKLLSNNDVIAALSESARLLEIGSFDPAMLQHSAYYLRVRTVFSANVAERSGGHSQATFDLLPSKYVLLDTIESLKMSSSIFALVGATTDWISQGLQLVHAPSVDPGFEGRMIFGALNLTDRVLSLRRGEVIGKLLFFDVSDTPIGIIPGSLMARKFEERRRRLRDDDPPHEDE